MLERLRSLWDHRPLAVVMTAAVVARVLCVLLSRGFAFYDDHFSVVEVAQHWVDGHHDWFGDSTSLRSLLYPGLHAVLFAAMERLGAGSPAAKMLAARALHAAWSLLTVWYGYKAARAIAGTGAARFAGLLLALFWLGPSMAVRNLVEVVCQPPLVAALYYLVRRPEERRPRDDLVAGLLLGLAFTLRFQTAAMAGAMGLVLLGSRRLGAAVRLGAGFAVSAALLQGGIDWLGYGKPFSSFLAYLAYNSDPANVRLFPQGKWHQYLGLVAGVLLPPAGLLLLYGFARSWRRVALAVWPAVAFIALHSFYPNKQERFILPALPFVLVAGAIGWHDAAKRWRAWRESPRARAAVWGLFWAVNAALLFLSGMNDWKRTRCEALAVVGAHPDAHAVLLEIDAKALPDPPLFYLGRELPAFTLARTDDPAALRARVEAAPAAPNYAVLYGEKDLAGRIARVEGVVGGRLEQVGRVEPSLVDRLLARANPRQHVNLPAGIYRVLR